MPRQRLAEAQKEAMKAKDTARLSAVRMILAAIKQRDIDSRVKPGYENGIPVDEILQLMQSMIKQRRESITAYEKGGRADLVAQEQGEIAVIESFLPAQMSDDEIKAAAQAVIAELGVASPKEMGKVIGALKSRHAGQMDFAKVAPIVKGLLGG